MKKVSEKLSVVLPFLYAIVIFAFGCMVAYIGVASNSVIEKNRAEYEQSVKLENMGYTKARLSVNSDKFDYTVLYPYLSGWGLMFAEDQSIAPLYVDQDYVKNSEKFEKYIKTDKKHHRHYVDVMIGKDAVNIYTEYILNDWSEKFKGKAESGDFRIERN